MVDTLALGASAARRGGSSPLSRTKIEHQAKAWCSILVWLEWLEPWVEDCQSAVRVFLAWPSDVSPM